MPDRSPALVEHAATQHPADGTRLVFVGGAPRSGTTLVQRLIGAHSSVYSGPEFDFMPNIAALRDDMRRAVESGRISAIVDAPTLDDAVAGMVRAIFGRKAASEGCTVFSEKTPANLAAFGTLLEIFPDARFVFVIRDPRDIVASMKEVMRRHRDQRKPAPAFIRSVPASCAEIERLWSCGSAAREVAPDRVLLVRYEDIVADPVGSAQRLCQFLDLPFEPKMVRIEEQKFDVTDDVESRSAWYREEEIHRPIERPEKERFRRLLTRAELGVIARMLDGQPATDPYPVVSESVTLGSRWILAKWALGRRLHAALVRFKNLMRA